MLNKVGPEWVQSGEKRIFDYNVGLFLDLWYRKQIEQDAERIRQIDGHDPYLSQERVGLFMVNFLMPKIRTMSIDTELGSSKGGHLDPRRLNEFAIALSASRGDERPQFKLIRQGTMTVVAPRAPFPVEVEEMMDLSSPPEQKELKRALFTLKGGLGDDYALRVQGGEIEDTPEGRRDGIVTYANTSCLWGDRATLAKARVVMAGLEAESQKYLELPLAA